MAEVADAARQARAAGAGTVMVHQPANPDRLLGDDAGWTPTLRARVHHPSAVPYLVDRHAGAGKLGIEDGRGRS